MSSFIDYIGSELQRESQQARQPSPAQQEVERKNARSRNLIQRALEALRGGPARETSPTIHTGEREQLEQLMREQAEVDKLMHDATR